MIRIRLIGMVKMHCRRSCNADCLGKSGCTRESKTGMRSVTF